VGDLAGINTVDDRQRLWFLQKRA